jgi:hypothetical protein
MTEMTCENWQSYFIKFTMLSRYCCNYQQGVHTVA